MATFGFSLKQRKNQNKSNKHPKQYFQDVEDVILEKALIPRELLGYTHFTKFVREREINILGKIKKSLGVKDNEMDYLAFWKQEDQ